MLFNCGVGEDTWESLGLKGDPTSPFWRRSVLNSHCEDWSWSWNSNTLATWCEELTHLKRRWCWEILKAGGEGDDRGWDDWMASLTRWTRVWVNSGRWRRTGKPGVLQSKESDMTEWLNWTELNWWSTNRLLKKICFLCKFLLFVSHNNNFLLGNGMELCVLKELIV